MSEHTSMLSQAFMARPHRNGDLETGENSDQVTLSELNTDFRGETEQEPLLQPVPWKEKQPMNNMTNTSQAHGESTPGKSQRQTDAEVPTSPNILSNTGAQPQGVKKPEKDVASSSNKTYGWRDVYNSYKQLDNDWAQSINEDISTLLLFAGLFATVLTAFLVQVYSDLQPDNTQLSAPILVDISKQLHALSLGQDAAATTISLTPATPSPLRVTTTALWLLSLILSLGAALFGILVKQWVREYMRWTSVYPLQHALHIRYHRREHRDRWHIEGTIVVVWTCLVLGLILFFFGLAILSFDVNMKIAIVAAVMVAIIFLAFLAMTLMPVVDSSCPYRTPFSSAIFIALSYTLSKFTPSSMAARDRWWQGISWRKILQKFKRTGSSGNRSHLGTSNHEFPKKQSGPWLKVMWLKIKTTWHTLILNTEKLWHDAGSKGLFWMEDVWSEWDKVLHLSDDAKESVLVRWKILWWLLSHQPHSDKDSLVVRCFSDLPGPPPPNRSPSQLKDKDWLEEHRWRASDKSKKPRLQFEYLCQVLVDSFSDTVDLLESPLPEYLAPIDDLPKFLTEHVWNIHLTSVYGPGLNRQSSASFGINLDNALRLYSKVQGVDPLAGHLLLKCISWLTETILNIDGQLSFEQIDFDFFAGLLTIYFVLVKNSDPDLGKSDLNLYDTYHRMMVNIISAGQSTRQRLGDSASTDSVTPVNVQRRIEFAGSLLYLSSSSNFSYTQPQRYDVKTIVHYVTAAVQFVERWNLKVPKQQDVTTIGDDHKIGYMPTTVFWALATVVFDTGSYRKEELNKRSDYYRQMKPFIRVLQRVVDFEAQHDAKWETQDNYQRCEMAAFLVLNHESIPHGFFETMKRASEKGIFDLTKMIKVSGIWITSPFVEEPEWVFTQDEYLDLLEKICNENKSNNKK